MFAIALAFVAVIWATALSVAQFVVGVLGFVVLTRAFPAGDYVSAMLGALVFLTAFSAIRAQANTSK